MQDLDGGPRGREILRRFYNRARDDRRSYKERQWSLPLEPGPHLFTDWRYILSAEVSGGFTWVSQETGEPVRVTDEHDELTAEPIDAVMVPYDVPEGIRISVCKAERSDPIPNHEPPRTGMSFTGFLPHLVSADTSRSTLLKPARRGRVSRGVGRRLLLAQQNGMHVRPVRVPGCRGMGPLSGRIRGSRRRGERKIQDGVPRTFHAVAGSASTTARPRGGEIRVEAAASRRTGGHSTAVPGRSFADCFHWREMRPTASSPGRPAKTWVTATDSRSRCASG